MCAAPHLGHLVYVHLGLALRVPGLRHLVHTLGAHSGTWCTYTSCLGSVTWCTLLVHTIFNLNAVGPPVLRSNSVFFQCNVQCVFSMQCTMCVRVFLSVCLSPVRETDTLTVDLQQMEAAVTEKTRMILIGSLCVCLIGSFCVYLVGSFFVCPIGSFCVCLSLSSFYLLKKMIIFNITFYIFYFLC